MSGEVYRAWDALLEREVALKLSRHIDDLSQTRSSLALNEARLLARIRHPNVVTVYGADHEQQRFGVWMEYIRGSNLETVLRQRGPMEARHTAVIGLDLCSAVAAAHYLGLLHGDITSTNIMQEKSGRVVLLDFGLSQDLRTLGLKDSAHNICGTPMYMAPEILRGGKSSVQSDIYGIGVVLYHLVTGRFPVEASSLPAARAMLAGGDVTLLPELTESFLQTIDRSLSTEPADRFGTVDEMARWLRESLHDM